MIHYVTQNKKSYLFIPFCVSLLNHYLVDEIKRKNIVQEGDHIDLIIRMSAIVVFFSSKTLRAINVISVRSNSWDPR